MIIFYLSIFFAHSLLNIIRLIISYSKDSRCLSSDTSDISPFNLNMNSFTFFFVYTFPHFIIFLNYLLYFLSVLYDKINYCLYFKCLTVFMCLKSFLNPIKNALMCSRNTYCKYDRRKIENFYQTTIRRRKKGLLFNINILI